MSNIHATCVELFGRGVLLQGAPGSGKSDLALRLIDTIDAADPSSAGALVADDRVVVDVRNGRLFARAPENLRGLLEIRGIGIVRIASADETELCLVVRLEPGVVPERLPDFDSQTVEIEGVSLPEIRLDPFQASAPARIRALVRALLEDNLVDSHHMAGDARPQRS